MQPVSRLFQNYCDAEHDLGLVADSSSDRTAEKNTERLNAALAECYPQGQARYLNGRVGPILYPIQFSAKEFFFAGTIETNPLIGSCALIGGGGGRAYPMISSYYTQGILGGATTRFTRIDGEEGGPFIRKRGFGEYFERIQFNGRPYTTDSTGEGPQTGTKTETCIEVEGRTAPAAGGLVMRDCTISDFTYGIRCLAGYYNDSGVFVSDENHADNGVCDNVMFWGCNSCFRSESIQAVCWGMNNCRVSSYGGVGNIDVVICDIARGGNVWINGLDITASKSTLLKVDYYSHNDQMFNFQNVKWDRWVGSQYYITLFHYAGAGEESAYKKWTARIHGAIAGSDTSPEYDATKLVRVTSGTLNLPFTDILCDVARMPTTNFSTLGHWKYPDSYWLGVH